MMHAQAVGNAPTEPTFVCAVASGNGGNRRYTLTWIDNSTSETAFVIERSSSPTGPWSILATVSSDRLTVGPGTGSTQTCEDKTKETFYYQVHAINLVGDRRYLELLQPVLQPGPSRRWLEHADARLQGRDWPSGCRSGSYQPHSRCHRQEQVVGDGHPELDGQRQ